MKISVDDQELFTLSEVQKSVIKNDIHEDMFDDDMKRRLQYILMHKYEQCFVRLKQEWDKKLCDCGVKMIPTDPEEYAKLVFSQNDYKDKKNRDLSQSELNI